MSNRKRPQPIQPKLIALAIAAFALGYVMLNYFAKMERVILGNTFHIIFGCGLMAVATLYIGWAVYRRFLKKPKKRRSRPVFLNEKEKNA